LIDTAFLSRDINEIDTVKDGRLIIPSEKLNNLVDGPITLLLYRETERPIRNGTRAGGRIVVSYGLRRAFELKPPKPPKGGLADAQADLRRTLVGIPMSILIVT
jgi:hypothetical protein